MGVATSAAIASWTGVAVTGVAALFDLIALKPCSDPCNRERPLVEWHLGWTAYFIGALAALVGFLAEGLGIHHTWIRYVGVGILVVSMIAAFTLVAGGGAKFVFINTTFALFTTILYVFSALSTTDEFRAGAFYIVGTAVAALMILTLGTFDLAQCRVNWAHRLMTRGSIVMYALLVAFDAAFNKRWFNHAMSMSFFVAYAASSLAYFAFFLYDRIFYNTITVATHVATE